MVGGWIGRLPDRLPTPRRTPFALLYAAVLVGTSLFAGYGDPGLVHRLQVLSSTDVHNLARHPVFALLFSAAWVAGPSWLPYLWAFGVTVAPLERRVGARSAAVVFAAGHVIATVISELVLVVLVSTGRLGPDALDVLDIGISYGVLASLGAVAGLLRPGLRAVALLGAIGLLVHQLLSRDDLLTAVGHPVALLVGIALWPWLRRRADGGADRGARREARVPELSGRR